MAYGIAVQTSDGFRDVTEISTMRYIAHVDFEYGSEGSANINCPADWSNDGGFMIPLGTNTPRGWSYLSDSHQMRLTFGDPGGSNSRCRYFFFMGQV